MFHRYGKKGRLTTTKALKDLIKIESIEHLLADDKRQQLVQQIKDNCALEAPRFDSLCQNLINNLINHCQNLPETSNSYYSLPGGMIDHALNRTEAALNLFKKYLILNDQTSYSEEQKLWQYALLSAALIQGIGKLCVDLNVDLYDLNGQLLKQWNPLLESLVHIGRYYTYEFNKESDLDFRRRLNLLLAKNLMPQSGFAWLASNHQVLAVWLALLHEDPYSAGTLGAILIRADAIALQRYFNQMNLKNFGARSGRLGRISTFADGSAESTPASEQQTALNFIQWLGKALESGIVMINKAPLLMVPGGLLMCAEMFRLFVREHPEYKNWQAVQHAFLTLGLHVMGKDGEHTMRFEGNNEMHTGIVVKDYAVILPEQVHFQTISGESVRLTATEVIHQAQFDNHLTQQVANEKAYSLPVLNESGQWQAAIVAMEAATTPSMTLMDR